MAKPIGWMGDAEDLFAELQKAKADVNENGEYCIYDEPVAQCEDGTVAVHQLSKFTVAGKPRMLAPLMHATGKGVKVVVF